tara:strand:+ start:85 stop:270 length:186 start_codon:yes stop_codon:yes gene_type:complete
VTTLYVQFYDSSEQEIIALFGGPQDPDVFPNQGTVDTSDTRWKAYYDKQDAFIKTLLPKPD